MKIALLTTETLHHTWYLQKLQEVFPSIFCVIESTGIKSSFSPEFNLIERFWKLFKKKVLYNRHYPTFKEFKLACLNFFKMQHLYEDEVFSIMGDGLLGLM